VYKDPNVFVYRFFTSYESLINDPYLFSDAYYGDGSGPIEVRLRVAVVGLGKDDGNCEICVKDVGILVHLEMKKSDIPYLKFNPEALEIILADKESLVLSGETETINQNTDYWFWELPSQTGSLEFFYPIKESDYASFKKLSTQSVRQVRVLDKVKNLQVEISPKDKLSLSTSLLCFAELLEEVGEAPETLLGLREKLDDIQFATTKGMSILYPTASLTGDGMQIPPETEIQILKWHSENVLEVSWEESKGFLSAEHIK
jgi:hypothetical protein